MRVCVCVQATDWSNTQVEVSEYASSLARAFHSLFSSLASTLPADQVRSVFGRILPTLTSKFPNAYLAALPAEPSAGQRQRVLRDVKHIGDVLRKSYLISGVSPLEEALDSLYGD